MKFFPLLFAFIVCTIIGTLSHEAGHIIVAKAIGYDTVLHYASMNYFDGPVYPDCDAEGLMLRKELDSNCHSKKIMDEYLNCTSKKRIDTLLISLVGPVQTLLTGFMGFGLLYLRRHQAFFSLTDWILVFLSFFSSRMLFNPLVSGTTYFFGQSDRLIMGDELHIGMMAGIPPVLLSAVLFLIALSICCLVVFRFMPVEFRRRFILCGILGSGLGYLVWMKLLGPWLLP